MLYYINTVELYFKEIFMKVNYEVKDNALNVGLDSNEDGQNSVSLKVNLSEALGEAFQKGTAVEGAKVVEVKFELTKLKVVLDTDKDDENLLELEIDLAEAFDEVSSAVSKDDSAEA